MAIAINKQNRIDRDNVYAECTAETVADVENDLPAFAESHEFQHGSVCICQENSEVYTMKPDYSWSILGE